MGSLVGQYGGELSAVKGKSVTATSDRQYSHAVDSFRRFAATNAVPIDIFMGPSIDIAYVVMCWTLHTRRHTRGRTHNPGDALGVELDLPITAKTLDQHVSGLRHFVLQHGGNANGVRCDELREIIKSFSRLDDITRGPSDFYVRYPLGAEFTWRVIQRIRASDRARPVQLLYEAATAVEYLFGLRVMEALEKKHVQRDPYVLPNVYYPDENPATVAKERAAAIHTVRNQDCVLFWRAENVHHAAHETALFPPRPPDFISMFQDHSKNWRTGAPPASIHANPGGANAAPFCLCAIVYEWLHTQQHRAAKQFLLLGADDAILRRLVKDTAAAAGLDPARAVLAGWRRGNASATIVGNAAQDIANALRQEFGRWHSAAGAQPYVEGQLDDGLEKTIQLYDLRTTNVAATLARFNRAHVA